jgi:hypothetical protein
MSDCPVPSILSILRSSLLRRTGAGARAKEDGRNGLSERSADPVCGATEDGPALQGRDKSLPLIGGSGEFHSLGQEVLPINCPQAASISDPLLFLMRAV